MGLEMVCSDQFLNLAGSLVHCGERAGRGHFNFPSLQTCQTGFLLNRFMPANGKPIHTLTVVAICAEIYAFMSHKRSHSISFSLKWRE